MFVFQKFHEHFLFRVSPSKIILIVRTMSDDGTQIWVEAGSSNVFAPSSLIIESTHEDTICMQMSVVLFEKALRSFGEDAHDDVTIRLTKADGVTAVSFQQVRGDSMLQHQVPVRCLPAVEWNAIREPTLPPPAISVVLPDVKQMRAIVSQYGRMSTDVEWECTPDGGLVMTIREESVHLSGKYNGLQILPIDDVHPPRAVRVCLATKRLAHALLIQEMDVIRCVASIVEEHALVLQAFLPIDDGIVTVFLPVNSQHEAEN
jgi:hypothetical protein